MSENPRIPENLRGLLKFCIKEQDGKQPEKDIDPERAAWLREALQTLHVDEVEEMKCLIASLIPYTDPSAYLDNSDACDKLDCLMDIVENIDHANAFIDIGGLDLIDSLHATDKILLKIKCAFILSIVMQNNPKAQEHGMKRNYIQRYIQAVKDEEDPDAIKHYVGVISSLSRSHIPGLNMFVNMQCVQSLMEKVKKINSVPRSGDDNSYDLVYKKISFLYFGITLDLPENLLCKFQQIEAISPIIQGILSIKPMKEFLAKGLLNISVDKIVEGGNVESSRFKKMYAKKIDSSLMKEFGEWLDKENRMTEEQPCDDWLSILKQLRERFF